MDAANIAQVYRDCMQRNSNLLSWSTASEINNSGFWQAKVPDVYIRSLSLNDLDQNICLLF